MTDPPRTELLRVAKRVVWFKPPEETLRDPVFFLNHVMTVGHGRGHPGGPGPLRGR